MNSGQRAILVVSILAVLATAACASSADTAPADASTLVVIASGTGADEKAALKQAFENAITQTIGTIVDAETAVKDDKIITDEVLTASNAIITRYDPIGSPKSAGGLVTVKIKATVQKKQLTDRLAAANVISKPVEGKDLFAQAVTDLQREKDGAAIVRRVFEGFPGNVLQGEPIGEPRLISKTDADAKIGVTIRYSYDTVKYGKWLAAVTPFLSKSAAKTEQRSLRTGDSGIGPLDKQVESWLAPHLPAVARRSSYTVRGRVNLIANDDPTSPTLVLIERTGGSRATILQLDDAVCREVVLATFAVPIAEILLKDQDGTEIDGLTRGLFFRQFNSRHTLFNVTPFFRPSFSSKLLRAAAFQYDKAQVDADWKPGPPELGLDTPERAVIVAPYIGFCGQDTASGQGVGNDVPTCLLTAYDIDYEFVVPLDRLKQIKTVEVKVYSRNNLLTERK